MSLDHESFDLEETAEEMRSMVDRAMERIVHSIETLPQQPAHDTEGGEELARSLIEPLPARGESFDQILDLLFERLIPKTFNTAGPGYLAYVPGGGLFPSAVADLIATAVNRYVGVFAAAPGLAQLEANVVRWFCQIVGYPEGSGGVLTSGGSLANFSAVVTARHERLPENFLSGSVYASDQIHHSVLKAARLAGIPSANVRQIPTDSYSRIRSDLLLQQIERDRKEGKTPFLLVASAGTTNTGAVDDLREMARIARDEELWLHVDAAYGGFFMLTDEGRQRLAGLELSDSLSLDPHKGLFIPYGTGSLLVRDRQALRRAHSYQGTYMPPMQDDPELIDFCEISPELSRSFRGLRVWLPLKLYGIEPFRRNLEEKLELTRWAAEQLPSISGIRVVAQPQLSVVAFRYEVPGLSSDQLNQLNRDLLASINRRKRVYLTATELDGQFVIRICVLSFRTHLARLRACLEDIRLACAELQVSSY